MWRQSHWVSVRWRREQGEAAAAPAVERAAQVALLEGAAQVALLGRVAHTALVERAARPEQVTRTALLVFSPPAAQAKTLSTRRVRALGRAPIRPPRTNNSILRTESGTPCRRLSIGRRSARRSGWSGMRPSRRVPPCLQARLRGHRVASAHPTRSGRCRDWIKSKNPAAPAVKRKTEEDWGRGK